MTVVAVEPHQYSDRMALFTNRPARGTSAVELKEYLDAAVGAVSDRMTRTERAISDRLDQSDRAAADQHARADARMEKIEGGLERMGERVGKLEQQHEQDVAREAGRESIMVPWTRGVVMPLVVIIVALLLGAGATALIVKAAGTGAELGAEAALPASACEAKVAALIATRDSFTASGYAVALRSLQREGCDIDTAVTAPE